MNTDVLVPAALVFVQEINRAYPGRDTTTDGSLASAEHSSNNPTSDHEHGTPQPGDRDVDAVDIDSGLVPDSSADSKRAMYTDVIPRFQAHPGTHYWIHDDQICFRSEGWVPRSYAYAGPHRNRHFQHCHFNWQETSAAHHNTSPYGITGVDMNLTDRPGNPAYPTRTVAQFMNDLWGVRDALLGDVKGTDAAKIRSTSPLRQLLALPARVIALDSLVKAALNKPPLPGVVTLTEADRAAIVAQVSAAVIAALPEYGPRPNTPS